MSTEAPGSARPVCQQDQPRRTLEPAELGAVLADYAEATRRLEKTHEALRHEVARLREELARKDRELERRRRLAALGELAAGLAHEVRNPLGAIQLYSNLLRRECARLTPALALIEKIEMGIQAIDAVVRDTLALVPRRDSDAGSGKSAGKAGRPLSMILAAAADTCRQKFEQHQVRLEVQLSDPRAQVQAEPEGLQRVLVNLMVNAAEASPPGRTVRVVAGPVEAGELAIRVIDEGCGLSEEVLERLFDPFFTTKEGGTGLGLSIAHRLVEAYGGRLAARNRPEGGAEFTVVLPAFEEAAGREASAPQTSAA
jgi:signal transduction histidine kinase